MRECSPISYNKILEIPYPNMSAAKEQLEKQRVACRRKIVVLDDDPTGIQTVHDVSVFTGWSLEEMLEGFREESTMFFILTNSRAFTESQTIAAHEEIARNIAEASRLTGRDFIVVSRGDSTLRGHYPLETEVLRKGLTENSGKAFDGEIILPFFLEGGRLTMNDIHYVRDGDLLFPAGLTEFAADKTFGYRSSNLKDWCEEKTKGKFMADDIISVSLDDLRAMRVDRITALLLSAKDFTKIVVNAVDYCDVEIFAMAFFAALEQGHEFLLRTAAAVPKVLGGISDKPTLTHGELVDSTNHRGGIVLVGSHVTKTTKQLEKLHSCKYPVEFIEFNQHLVLTAGALTAEVERVVKLAEETILAGKTVVVYTRRQRLDLDSCDGEQQLIISVAISDAVTSIIGKLTVKPAFIIAKGGITSSDVGTKALGVKRATVMGQLCPGIPVWMTGSESKFPQMPYVIFPGNVGAESTLCEAVEILMDDSEETQKC